MFNILCDVASWSQAINERVFGRWMKTFPLEPKINMTTTTLHTAHVIAIIWTVAFRNRSTFISNVKYSFQMYNELF